jgi:FAD/FMN-containing dehydrogenase
VPDFAAVMAGVAAEYGYPTKDIGVYLQPLDRARACHCRFGFHCNPEDAKEMNLVRNLFLEASERAISMGGFFSTPYGPWADMVYSRAATYTYALKVVKNAYDPNNILNPGKLCL